MDTAHRLRHISGNSTIAFGYLRQLVRPRKSRDFRIDIRLPRLYILTLERGILGFVFERSPGARHERHQGVGRLQRCGF
jgi:hypothetical protein